MRLFVEKRLTESPAFHPVLREWSKSTGGGGGGGWAGGFEKGVA